MRRSNCASALQYVPELTWILFLRILDAQEQKEREEAEALGNSYSPALLVLFAGRIGQHHTVTSLTIQKHLMESRKVGKDRNSLLKEIRNFLTSSTTNYYHICMDWI
jgi:hypothetical protein